jgi:imidazole glycerol-phosphate synthase subunit HisH
VKLCLFDYGAGNLHSLAKALSRTGAEVRIDTDPLRALETDALVLPGVGAFGAAAQALAPGREQMRAALEGGLPCLGICLGMQLLFSRSEEGGGEGLGFVAGEVTRLRTPRVPHIGWNTLEDGSDRLFITSRLRDVYYAHSFACRPEDDGEVLATTSYGKERFAAALRKGRTVGVQFHPEKSSSAGLEFLMSFVEEAER